MHEYRIGQMCAFFIAIYHYFLSVTALFAQYAAGIFVVNPSSLISKPLFLSINKGADHKTGDECVGVIFQ